MNSFPALLGSVLGISCLGAAPVTFYSQSGNNSALDGVLDGRTVADHLGLSSYDGFVGQLAIIPTSPSLLAAVTNGTAGMITADSGGTFSNLRGLAGFCIDSETSFLTSSSQNSNQQHSYEAYSYASANYRYMNENVEFYLAGGLKRAAYLLETYYGAAHSGGDTEAAALQTAIWEVLYDANPNVSLNQGNYYIRTNSGNSSTQAAAALVANQANSWLNAAATANWGGANYDPGNRVLFWLDPTNSQVNQSILTLNPGNWGTTSVPEPQGALLVAAAFGMGLLVRRRR